MIILSENLKPKTITIEKAREFVFLAKSLLNKIKKILAKT